MKASARARDEWLALRCQAGVEGAFADFIAEMDRSLFYYAAKVTGSQDTAGDVLQEVWLRALRGIRKLKDPASVRAWLYTVVHGVAVDMVRRDRSRERAEETHAESFDQAGDSRFGPSEAAAVHQSLDRIEPSHREVLVLYFLEEFSLEEISRIVGCPEGTIKSRMYYAKKALRMSGETNANRT